ncbi:MAG: DNA starvation/stationary phase protection protein [Balneolaceae bacterium]
MNIGIKKENRKAVCDRLQVLLADEFILYTKLRNYHWNIKANNFSELHNFYEEQYEEIAGIVDEVAERIRMLGHLSNGRLADYLELTQLNEEGYTTEAEVQIKILINNHETIIRYLRECITDFDSKYGDIGTSDFITALMEKHEKMRWMLDSFLT